MNCLSDYKIQEYIDNELTKDESRIITNHLNSCTKCKSKTEQQIKFVNQLLLNINSEENETTIPEFKFHRPESEKTNLTKIKKLVYWLAVTAAILVFFFLVYTPNQDHAQEISEEILFIEFEFETDANKPWSEQEVSICITEKNKTLNL